MNKTTRKILTSPLFWALMLGMFLGSMSFRPTAHKPSPKPSPVASDVVAEVEATLAGER